MKNLEELIDEADDRDQKRSEYKKSTMLQKTFVSNLHAKMRKSASLIS